MVYRSSWAGGYTGEPQLAEGFAEAEALGGYSDGWNVVAAGAITGPKYNLCEAMYAHHKLFGVQPAIYMNVLDPATHKTAVPAANFALTNHQAKLPIDAINDAALVVKSGPDYIKTIAEAGGTFVANDAASITTASLKVYADSTKATLFELTTDYTISYSTPNLTITPVAEGPMESLESVYVEAPFDAQLTYVKDEDYTAFYSGEHLIVEALPDGDAYAASLLNIAYNEVDPSLLDAEDIEGGIEKIELCKTLLGVVPDLICIPGWSDNPAVAAVMAAKAPGINGIFRAKAVVDLPTDSAAGADSYDKVAAVKAAGGYIDENMIPCWLLGTLGERVFHMSSQMCGLMAQKDLANGNCPYESPSNLSLKIDGTILADGTKVNLTIGQADVVSATAGVVTALNFDGWVSWGNYTGAFAAGKTAPEDIYICCGRTLDWAMNTFINTYWPKIDRPMSKVWRDSIIDSFNAWLNGLVHDGKLLGGELSYIESVNTDGPLADRIRLDLAMASPMPAQRIDLHAEYSVADIVASLTA